MKKLLFISIAGLVFFVLESSAFSLPKYLDEFKKAYPETRKTKLGSCLLCHFKTGEKKKLNPFAQDFKKEKLSFAAVENLDSDKDRFLNIEEVTVGTFPGDNTDKPDISELINQIEFLKQKIENLEQEIKELKEKRF